MILGQTADVTLKIPVEYSTIFPMLALIGGALVLLTWSSLIRRRRPTVNVLVAILSAAVSLGGAWSLWDRVRAHGPMRAIGDAIVIDGFAVFFMVVIAIAVVLGSVVGDAYLRREDLDGPEFHVLLLLSASGGMLMAAANDLIVLFLGLEILSIALYVLAGFHGRRQESHEAAMKYFVLGAFSSALFLYGIALVYGATGSTNLPTIGKYLAENVVPNSGVLLIGMVLLLVGLGFKVAAVPFHTWTPDVYQGSPSPVTGFMAAAAKAAGFAGLLRVFFSTFTTLRLDWQPIIAVLAVATLLVGSVLAIVQNDIKRMLAYSSISHAGYVLVGLQAASARGIAGSLFYLLAYTFMVLGSFAIVTVVGRRGDARHEVESYRGLSSQRPALALAFTVLLMAQAGIPFTTGFLAKFYVIAAAVDSGSYALAVIAMLAAVVAAFFYLRVIIVMYSPVADGDESPGVLPVPRGIAGVLVIAVVFTITAGLLPGPVIDFARHATLIF
ncbi:MAG TPA: NADH-quinone oxidoreductase subunit N [Acidimicrobiales bacterium]|nr:NADH-quinone oxidoreductase subunit N [Acidimicrobiales bacterium]